MNEDFYLPGTLPSSIFHLSSVAVTVVVAVLLSFVSYWLPLLFGADLG